MTNPDVDRVRALRSQAEDVPPLSDPDDPGASPQDGSPGNDDSGSEDPFLPDGCPVQPLGVNNDMYFYLDQLGQLREVKAKEHSRLNVQSMFGRLAELLYDFWPRYTKTKKGDVEEFNVTGWKPEVAAEKLMGAAAVKGVWNPNERVRGAGAWRGANDELILHVGDQLVIVPANRDASGWKSHAPGVVGSLVYPTAAPAMKPFPAPQPMGPEGPGSKALNLFSTWNFRRKDLDPYLLLGWIGCAMLGGALTWRPLAWTTGDSNTGKSSLQQAIKWCFGETGLLHTSDASSAAVRQILKYASLPVAIDEAEAEEDQRRMSALIRLARDAATGALAVRGGSDHQASQFTVRSCFLFTSILIPPLLPQDRNRMAILELDALEPGTRIPAAITPANMALLGSQLMRRLVDQWGRWTDTVTSYRDMLARAGHSARGQDVFGSLLAAADLLLYDSLPDSDTLAGWETRLAASSMAEIEGVVKDYDACLAHLLSTVVDDSHNRRRYPIGHWIGRAVGRFDGCQEEQQGFARDLLQEHGIKIHLQDGETWVAIANMHRGLTKIYDGTQWASRPGAQGVWVQSLRRLPHKRTEKPLWFGAPSRATLLSVDACLPSRPQGGTHNATAAASPGAGDVQGLGLTGVHADEGGGLDAPQDQAVRSAAVPAGADDGGYLDDDGCSDGYDGAPGPDPHPEPGAGDN